MSPEGQSRWWSAFTKQQRLVRLPTKRSSTKPSQANNGVLKCSLEVIVAITTFRSQTRQKIALSPQIVLSITSLFLCLCLRLHGTLFPHFSVRSPSSHFLKFQSSNSHLQGFSLSIPRSSPSSVPPAIVLFFSLTSPSKKLGFLPNHLHALQLFEKLPLKNLVLDWLLGKDFVLENIIMSLM